MNTIQLDNVFNYVPNSLRDMIADDDQIKSWALQAARDLNFKHFQYVRDISFYSVTNHKAVIDPGLKRILKVDALQNSTLNQSQVDILYECCNEEYEAYPESGTFATQCPIYHRMFIASEFYANCWQPVEKVQNLTDDYFCNVEAAGCNEVYSFDSDSRILQTSFSTGVIAVTGYWNVQDCEGNFMLPEEPLVLWRYMAAYAVARWLEDQMLMGKQNISTLTQMWYDRETKFRNSLRGTWTLMSMRSKNIQSIISTRFLRNTQVMLEYVSNVNRSN